MELCKTERILYIKNEVSIKDLHLSLNGNDFKLLVHIYHVSDIKSYTNDRSCGFYVNLEGCDGTDLIRMVAFATQATLIKNMCYYIRTTSWLIPS